MCGNRTTATNQPVSTCPVLCCCPCGPIPFALSAVHVLIRMDCSGLHDVKLSIHVSIVSRFLLSDACETLATSMFFLFISSVVDLFISEAELLVPGPALNVFCTAQLDLGAELLHGDQTSLYRLAEEKGWEMEELISLAQGDGGPLPADSNDGWGLFYVGGEKRMLALDSKVRARRCVHL